MLLPVNEDKMLFNILSFLPYRLKKGLCLQIPHLFALEGFLMEADVVGWDDHILGRVAIQYLLHLCPFILHIFNRIENLFILIRGILFLNSGDIFSNRRVVIVIVLVLNLLIAK